MTAHREFQFTQQDFDILRQLVSQHTGIALSEHKQEMLYSRLARRLRILNLNSFAEYCELLKSNGGDELMQFMNAVTTNLTAFFREPHHFEQLATHILPALLEQKAEQQRLRIWSAGCASGEEAYSLAIVLREHVPSYWNVKILATDLDSNVLGQAIAGIYNRERVAMLSAERLQRWFKKGTGNQAGMVLVSPDLQKMISFRQLNLIYSWPMNGMFDIIFCRNVMIYFSKHTQIQLYERFANILEPNGYFFVGHSENLFKLTERFQLVKQTIYRKIS